MKKKIAFFDVDKTILEGDSMFDLLFWSWRKHAASIIPSCLAIAAGTARYVLGGRKDIRLMKNGIFYSSKYLSSAEIERFVKEVLFDKRVFKDAVDEIQAKHAEGYTVVFVSASPKLYLDYFYDLFPVDKIIGTDLDAKGRIAGENCKHQEKVVRIEKWLEEEDFEIDYENSCGYSDSYSADHPMLSLVKNRYLINTDLKIAEYKNLFWN